MQDIKQEKQTHISVELVPRDEATMRASLEALPSASIDAVNVPDLLRFEMRSWQGAAIAEEMGAASIPHIRAMDIDLAKPLPMVGALRASGIKKVLVIQGDPPQDMMHAVYPTESVDVIHKFREEMPEVTVYAGLDQYRSNMREEAYRLRRKAQAGAQGFFTQPFFDLRYLEMYADLFDTLDDLRDTKIFWGLSPVTSARSQSYWELKNQVVFPKHFVPTLAASIQFAREALAFARTRGDSVYLMPIRADVKKYVDAVLSAI